MKIKLSFYIIVVLFLVAIIPSVSLAKESDDEKEILTETLIELKETLEKNPEVLGDSKQINVLKKEVFQNINKNIESTEGTYEENILAEDVLKTNLKLLKLKDFAEWYILSVKETLPYEKELLNLKENQDEDSMTGMNDDILNTQDLMDTIRNSEEKESILSIEQELDKISIMLLLQGGDVTLEQALERTKKTLKEVSYLVKEYKIVENPHFQGLGSFMWPIEGSRITSDFGERIHPISKRVSSHNGVDVGAPTGTHLFASADGVIEKARSNGGYGKVVVINHENGYKTLYAHNSELIVEEGQRVEMGDLIAKVGSTGNSTGPHLHFEIFKNEEAGNPMDYFK